MGDHRRARRQRTACWNDILRSVKSCEPESSTVRRAKSSSLCRSIKAFRRASACSSENCRGPVTMGTPLTTEKYMVWDGLEIKPHLGGHWEHTQPSVTDQLELSNALTSTQCCPHWPFRLRRTGLIKPARSQKLASQPQATACRS